MTKAIVRYPAEWEDQAATWLAFPHNKKNWYGERGEMIRKFYIDLIRTISEFQPVNVLVPKKDDHVAHELLKDLLDRAMTEEEVQAIEDKYIKHFDEDKILKIIHDSKVEKGFIKE